MPILRVEQQHQKPFEIEIHDLFHIGRSSENDLCLNDLSLSRQHAFITCKNNKYVLEDMNSRNGTFLNGVRLRAAQELKSGDRIQLGEVLLHFLEPKAETVQVTDSTPGISQPSTYKLETDGIDFLQYLESARASTRPLKKEDNNIWAVLGQAGAALMMHYSMEELVEVILDILLQVVPADRAALALLDDRYPDELQIKAIRSTQEKQRLSISRTVLSEVMRDRKAILILDTQADARFGSSKSIQIQGIRSIICVPLFHQKKVKGLIYLDNLASGRLFQKSDLQAIALLANMAAVKIENAQLMQEQIHKKQLEEQLIVASQIQRKLLPQQKPSAPGYEITGMARTCFQIGGDYYDFIPKDGSKLGIVIADVSGKGVAAALLMAVFQATIRTLVKAGTNIEFLMASLNRMIIDNSPSNKFVTVFYGELNHRDNTFEYVNAGHNAPILITQGRLFYLDPHAPLIGALPEATYASRKIQLHRDDLLFLYTDGVTEARNLKDTEFGMERLVDFLQRNKDQSVEDLSELLDNAIREFTGSAPLLDDTTFVWLKRL